MGELAFGGPYDVFCEGVRSAVLCYEEIMGSRSRSTVKGSDDILVLALRTCIPSELACSTQQCAACDTS